MNKTSSTKLHFLRLFIVGLLIPFSSIYADIPQLTINDLGEGYCLVRIQTNKKYVLLPVEESSPDVRVSMVSDNQEVKAFDVKLAVTKVDYLVPVDISSYSGKEVLLKFKLISLDPVRVNFSSHNAACCLEMKLSDEYDTSNREKYRPSYHFTPVYGWMNDPNGMVYKDGIYHLFYQYNPYGSMWGNMHWGHATSTDLIHWEHCPVAIAPDALGAIFSGSCVVDKDNTAGFGAGTIVAFYTSAGERQTQSMAYSLDNGKTFKKYEHNPILTSTQQDFRDPKVLWHAATNKWVMVLAVGQELQFYSSSNLKDWNFESRFGDGEGAHGGVWECPDLIELPVEGSNQRKWVLVCNINPGGPFGGSATQYFVGEFDGKKFVNDSPSVTKWMDWGKDHYATVTWNNAPAGRHVALAWMSNWEYANNVPTSQFRSANSVPRELSLFVSGKETYLKSAPVNELLTLRDVGSKKRQFKVDRPYSVDKLLPTNTGAYEIEMTINNKDADLIGFSLFNSKGEKVDMYYDLLGHKFAMDRTQSGISSFSKDFSCITSAPLINGNEIKLRLLIDKSSIEAFGNDGRFVMTNLIFPSEPYNSIRFYAKGGTYSVTSFNVFNLEQK